MNDFLDKLKQSTVSLLANLNRTQMESAKAYTAPKVLNLTLERFAKRQKYTIGKLYVDDVFFCHTLEDTDRGLTQDMPLHEIQKKKIYGETAIPRGRYRIVMNVQSPAYSKKPKWMQYCKAFMPRLMNVPGWSGVLIHTGQTPEHTLGCICVGDNTVVGQLRNSDNTFYRLYPVLKKADRDGKEIWITIK